LQPGCGGLVDDLQRRHLGRQPLRMSRVGESPADNEELELRDGDRAAVEIVDTVDADRELRDLAVEDELFGGAIVHLKPLLVRLSARILRGLNSSLIAKQAIYSLLSISGPLFADVADKPVGGRHPHAFRLVIDRRPRLVVAG
jgi:hypothetical protein